MKKRLISGIKPTGTTHIGNYFGMILPTVSYQEKYEVNIFVANYHSLTTVKDGPVLKEMSLNLMIDLLAAGIDPKKTNLFLQSAIPELGELTWIFNCLTTMPYLMRAHAFKDAEAKRKEVNVGLFDYPVLMAADILAQRAEVVPVGQDQKQHVEIARDLAEKFNQTYGREVFVLPEAMIKKETAIVPGPDGEKMSKSYGNILPLFAEDEEITKIIMSIKTDSKGKSEPKETSDTLFCYHELFSTSDLLEKVRVGYNQGGVGYQEIKESLIESVKRVIAPLREKRKEVAARPKEVLEILAAGNVIAKENAQKTISLAREVVGLL